MHFVWQAWDNVTANGSDVRPGVPWAPHLLRGRRGKMSILRGRRGTMCTANGSDVRPGVPWARSLLRGRRGTMCTANGSDVRSASLGLRFFCVAGVGQCALPRLDVRPGVFCAPPLLRGRRGTMCIAKGSYVRPGVPWAPLLLRGRRGTMCTAKSVHLLKPYLQWERVERVPTL